MGFNPGTGQEAARAHPGHCGPPLRGNHGPLPAREPAWGPPGLGSPQIARGKSVALARAHGLGFLHGSLYIASLLRVTVATDFILLKPGPACDAVGKEQLRGDEVLRAGCWGRRLGSVPAATVRDPGAGWAGDARGLGPHSVSLQTASLGTATRLSTTCQGSGPIHSLHSCLRSLPGSSRKGFYGSPAPRFLLGFLGHRSPPCRRVRFAEFRCQREVVMIFGLDIWAGLPGGVGSLVPAQGEEGTLVASIAREAHDGAALPWG